MPPPPQQQCSHDDCDYKTPPGCPSWEMLLGFLQQHTQAVHGGGGDQQAQSTSKLEKLPRPTFTLNMSESQWSFKKIQWDSYIKQNIVSESVKLVQLQAACDEDLRQRVFDTGTYASLTTEAKFLAKMKELAEVSCTGVGIYSVPGTHKFPSNHCIIEFLSVISFFIKNYL